MEKDYFFIYRFWAFSIPLPCHIGLFFRPKGTKKGTKNRSFLGDFGPFLGWSGITLGSLRDDFGIILARFGVVLIPFWGLFLSIFGLFFGPFWGILAQFWPFPRSFCEFFFLAMFWEVVRKNKPNDAREGKHMQISVKIHQKYAKLCKKKKPVFAYKTLVLLKKTVKIDVSTYESVQ